MSALFKQETRLGKLHTALPPDTLVLARFGGTDRLNGLFEYRVEALSTSSTINFDDLLGTHATVEVQTISQGPRFFDGIVTQARWAGPGANGFQYEIELRPWLWLASRQRQQRIFHNRTVGDIIEDVLGAYASVGEFDLQLSKSYEPLEYTVQYGESDMAFVCRLMERFGINYHFDFGMQKHVMVMTDVVDDLPQIPGGTRKYLGNDSKVHGEDEHFWNWQPERNVTTGAIRLKDFNFKTPTSQMETEKLGTAEYAQGQLESYDFPGDYLDSDQGGAVAGLRLEQEQSQDLRHRAIGDVVSLSGGMRVTLDGQHEEDLKGMTFVCLAAQHFFEADAYGSGAGSGSGTSYTGSYTLTADDAPVVPPRKTPAPVIVGPQTAWVVGEGEIDCDEYGRILVHFHWDLEQKYSMRCRVSQSWASQGWGGMVIPRIGMEVIVEFINGDPDQPIVTGCVYNGRNKVPYELPKHKTRSTFKTETHKGRGFNELRFEDEKGEEEIRLYAQKDMNTIIQNNGAMLIAENYSEMVGENRLEETLGHSYQTFGASLSIVVGDSGQSALKCTGLGMGRNLVSQSSDRLSGLDSVAGKEGSINLICDGERHDITHQNSSEIVGGQKQTTISQEYNLSVQSNVQELIGENKTSNVSGWVSHTAGRSYSIVCGQSKIVMSADGRVDIVGSHISINGTKISLN